MAKKSKSETFVEISSTQKSVTGSCTLVTVRFRNGERVKFLVDCGSIQGEGDLRHDFIRNSKLEYNPDDLIATIITHAHLDHCGRVGLLKGKCPIICSKGTFLLMKNALADNFQIMSEQASKLRVQLPYRNKDLSNSLSNVKTVDFGESVYIHDKIKVTLFANNHIFGASIVLIQIMDTDGFYKEVNLLFTGDYNSKNRFLEQMEELPEWVKDLHLTVISEATYGKSSKEDITYEAFRNNIKDFIKNQSSEDWVIVIPAFSLGRTPEVLYELKSMEKNGDLPKDCEIICDGRLSQSHISTMLKNWETFRIKEEMLDFEPKFLILAGKELRASLIFNKPKCPIIIVTSSGMGTHGPARSYLPHFCQSKNCLIHFTGFTVEGSLGRRLQDAPLGSIVKISGAYKHMNAVVKSTNEFSSHAMGDEIIEFLEQFKNLECIIINHGEPEIKEFFAKRIDKELTKKVKDIKILDGETTFRVGTFGLMSEKNNYF